MMVRLSLALLLLGTGVTACGPSAPEYVWQLPKGFPEPFVPEDNPMSEAKVALGRRLFHDTRLSGNGTYACATCHLQSLAFADGLATPKGSTGDVVPRNSPGLANVGYYSFLTWANPLLDTLEKQALVPMFGEAPVELGLTGALPQVLQRFAEDAEYAALFEEAFPERKDPVHEQSIVRALASFQRTMVSGSSAYDRYINGETEALSASAKKGMELFFSEKGECYHCHGGLNFTTAFRSKSTAHVARDFQNTGLYNVGGTGAYPAPNTGLHEFTGLEQDMGLYRPPTLRNVALTAPYMHDGSVATLGEVVDLYAAGGRVVADGPNAGDGRTNPNKSALVRPFALSAEERQGLIDFLESLTDPAFIADERFSDPFAR